MAALRAGATFESDDPIFFLYRFGGQPWSDAPYSWHLVPAAERVLPPDPLGPDDRPLLTVILVDAASGLVRALRALSLPPPVAAPLHAAIRAQATAPFDPTTYDLRLTALYAQYPTTPRLLGQSVARAQLGA